MEQETSSSENGGRGSGRMLPALVGFAAAAGQILLMRELLVLFNGNEISVGILLAVWLAWTAAGAAIAGWAPMRATGVVGALCGASLPATIWFLRGARLLFTPVAGELLGPVPMLGVSVLYLAAFCGLSGGLFALAARRYAERRRLPQRTAMSYAYALETAGAALGGLTTGALLRGLGAMQIAMLVCILDLAAGLLVAFRWKRRWAVALGLCAIAVPVVAWIAPRMETRSLRREWPGIHIVDALDSVYGRIAVTDAGGVRTVYQDGAAIANAPDKAAAEEAVHFALLEHAAPRAVLTIGGGLNGSVAEALKYRTLERLDYVELDPASIAMYGRDLPAEFAAAFADRRVHVHAGDGRRFLETAAERYDAILVDVPEPETAQWNRFYTVEFFRTAREHLAAGGLLALQVRSQEEFVSPERAEFLRCIRRTLGEVFGEVAAIPGDPLHLIAAASRGTLTEDPQELIARLRARRIETLYVAEDSLPFRMSPERTEAIRAAMQPEKTTPVNSDFHPIAYYFGSVLWSAQFGAGYGSLLRQLAAVRFGALAAGLAVAMALLCLWLAVPQRRARGGAAWVLAAGGYSLMTLQVLLLFTFQCLYGYVYAALALVVGMFMAGLAAGTWAGIARTRHSTNLVRVAGINQLLCAAMPAALMAGVALMTHTSLPALGGFAALAFVCSVPAGFQFPLATEIYFRDGRDASATLAYALDLAGGCAGALLVSGILAPLFGFWACAWLAAIMAAPGAVLALPVRLRRQGPACCL